MKKLKLNGIQPLSKDQMKNISGGYSCVWHWCIVGSHASYEYDLDCGFSQEVQQMLIGFWEAAGCNAGYCEWCDEI
jgi:natural product precursor